MSVYAASLTSTPNERAIASAMTLAMHVLFLVLLVLGVNWQRTVPPTEMVAELWSTLPSSAPPQPQPQPEVKPEPPPPPPKPPEPAPRVEVKPPPAPVVPPKIDTSKADIALKDKKAKEEKEKKDRVEKEKADKAKTDARKKEEDQMRMAALKAEQTKTDAAARAAKDQADAQARAAAAAASAQAQLQGKYIAAIREKIKRFVILPPNIQGNPEGEFDVILLPGGEVLDVRLRKSSGNKAYDEAVERAIRKAQPLPIPPDPTQFQQFRELRLAFRPQE
ncbi:MAG: cell envelope integrity protein TolA [Burkholderiales bacterium]